MVGESVVSVVVLEGLMLMSMLVLKGVRDGGGGSGGVSGLILILIRGDSVC